MLRVPISAPCHRLAPQALHTRWKRVTDRMKFTKFLHHNQMKKIAADKEHRFLHTAAENGRKFSWYWIPPWLGIVVLACIQYRHVVTRERRKMAADDGTQGSGNVCPQNIATNFMIEAYKRLPLRILSRVWEKIDRINLPIFAREPLLGRWAAWYNCNMEEAEDENFANYKNLNELFRRNLKPSARPIGRSVLVSPADGKILHLGKVEKDRVEQVKGMTYSLEEFFGAPTWRSARQAPLSDVSGEGRASWLPVLVGSVTDSPTLAIEGATDDEEEEELGTSDRLRMRAGTQLLHCVIYLAPGDYHGFHAPAACRLEHRRHFPGHLMSVNPGVARCLPSLFALNERVLLAGSWPFGFFSLTAVGATSVGSITIHFDKFLKTNRPRWQLREMEDRSFIDPTHLAAIQADKGSKVGEFNLGSTIVLIFEAPASFEFLSKPGDRVRMGQDLGRVAREQGGHIEEKIKKTMKIS